MWTLHSLQGVHRSILVNELDRMLAQPSDDNLSEEDEGSIRDYQSDTSVDSALADELDRMLAQPSDKESDNESDVYEDEMPRHLERVRTQHRRGVEQTIEQWQENEEIEGIMSELKTEFV